MSDSHPGQPLSAYRVLLTGACGGIGAAITAALAGLGAHLVLSSRSVDKLRAVADHLPESTVCHCIEADLSDSSQAESLASRAAGLLGGLDCVINNAGFALQLPVEQTSVQDWDSIMAVNARAPFLICKSALPYLELSPSARIINISSVVGTKAYLNQAAYAASKHALEGFTKVLAREVFDAGIRVHIVAPGGVDTPMVREMRPDIQTPGLIQAEEVSDAVVRLLTMRGNAVIDRIDLRRQGKEPWV